ncbi:MAG TPA: hypothetical protein VMP01_29040 [Pirellulaceae bacterium]|nr:hypothetical protein [Pirellulaceae bacterium]
MSRSLPVHLPPSACQFVAAWVALAALVAPVAAAEGIVSGNYKTWSLEQPNVHRRSAYRDMLRDGTVRDETAFDQVATFKLSELTREENLFDLPKLRRQLRYDLSLAGRAPDRSAHDRIVGLAMEHLPSIVDDRAYHAGTRFNALLLLGELNSVEERPFPPAAFAVPLADALPLLVAWLESAADDGSTRDFIPLGALLGILRHAQQGIADEPLRQRALQAAVALAGQSQPPEQRSAVGHDWLRRRAIHLIAWAVKPGATPLDDQAVALVWNTIDDPSASLKLQVEGALAWSLLSPKVPQEQLDSAATLSKLSALTGRVLKSELHSATATPRFASRQSRRVVAGQLGLLSHACRQLGVDVVSLRRSGPPTNLAELSDLYCGLKSWIGVATDPRLASRQAAAALADALTLLELKPPVVAHNP